MQRRYLDLVCRLCVTVGLATCATAFAADWPTKPIRMVVPANAGGAGDELARAIQEPLQRALGQPVVIDNKGGAFGAIGAMEVARAAPDGHTLLLGLLGANVIVPLQQKTGYDPVASFTPVSTVATVPIAIYARADIPVTNTRELVGYARTLPQGMNFAVTGGIAQIYTDLLAREGKFKAVRINYKGGGQATTAILSGEVDAWITTPSGLLNNYIKAGKLRAVGVTTPEPSPLVPGAEPVTKEIPGLSVEYWFGLFGPAGMPADVTARLAQAMAEIVAQPGTRARYAEIGFVPQASTPQAFAARISHELDFWRKTIQELDAKTP